MAIMERMFTLGTAAMLTVGLLAQPLPAATGARGTFSNQGETLKIVDAFAYEGKAAFGGEMAVRVRLSARPLDHRSIESVIDFAVELDRQRGGGPSVDLEFSQDGSWSGMSYQLGSSRCQWCADRRAAAKSRVAIQDGTIRGTLRVQAADYREKNGPIIDLALDLAVTTLTGTSPLPPDGGEPAKAFLACRQLVKAKDVAGVRKSCFLPDDTQLDGTRGSGGDGFWVVAFWNRDSLTLDAVKVTGGQTKSDWAELAFSGRDESGRERKGNVLLRRGPSGWRYHHEGRE